MDFEVYLLDAWVSCASRGFWWSPNLNMNPLSKALDPGQPAECCRSRNGLTTAAVPCVVATNPPSSPSSCQHPGVTMEVPDTQTRSLQHLPAAVLSHAFSFLPSNESTLTARFICRDAAAALSDAEQCSASLCQPLPPHALPWAVEAGQQHVRQLPTRHKLQLLSTAAASGSEVNLEAALALLQQSIFPEMLITGHSVWANPDILPRPDPGEAACKAGRPQLLGWLLRYCPALLHPGRVLQAAAEHCDLAGLQGVWGVLQGDGAHPVDWAGRPRPAQDQEVLDAAARSRTADGVAKMEWLLAGSSGSCRLQESTAEAAARSGDLGRLRWLQERGCRLDTPNAGVLMNALEHAGMGVVRWLVDEAGCDLMGRYQPYWAYFVVDAARSAEGLARMRWLEEQGVELVGARELLSTEAPFEGKSFTVGQVQTLRYMMQRHSGDLSHEQQEQQSRAMARAVVESGSVALAEELLASGFQFGYQSYCTVCSSPDPVAITRWLLHEADVSARELELWEIMWDAHCLTRTPAGQRQLLQVVQLLLRPGAGADWWDIRSAAEDGNLGLVQFLAQHVEQQLGHPPDWPGVLAAAAGSGCEALVEWVAGKPGALEQQPSFSFGPKAKIGDLGALRVLRRLGVRWGTQDTVAQAVNTKCPAPVLRWLVEQGAPMGRRGFFERVVAAAVRDGELDAGTAAWLRDVAAERRRLAAKAAGAAAAATAGEVLACAAAWGRDLTRWPRCWVITH